jgi:hypothetical protein
VPVDTLELRGASALYGIDGILDAVAQFEIESKV